jgi:hypothetical protein
VTLLALILLSHGYYFVFTSTSSTHDLGAVVDFISGASPPDRPFQRSLRYILLFLISADRLLCFVARLSI